jgi:hypothetical protein
VLPDVFLAYIFLAYVEPKLFFCFRAGKFSSAAPITIASSVFFGGGCLRVRPTRRCDLVVPADGGWGCSN